MNKSNNFLSLNGQWKYITEKDNSLTFNDIKSIYLKKELREINIPSNWFLTEIGDFAGSVWFIKEFDYEQIDDNLIVLQFDGVDYFAEVYLNDQYLGKHEGYFQRFYFDVSDQIKVGKNTLIVKVNSPKEDIEQTWPDRKKLIKGIFNHHDCRPGGWDKVHGQDRNTGGIWNSVQIYQNSIIYIPYIKIFSKISYSKNLAQIVVEFPFLSNKKISDEITLNIEIKLNSEIICKKEFSFAFNSERETNFIAEINNPRLWFPYDIGEPILYELNVYYKEEKILNKFFGLREVELINDTFYINKKRLFLRGTNIIPEQLLSSLTEIKIKELIDLLKEANINIVRVHAHVNRQELYNYFDREGILVWQDFALQWTYDESSEFISNAVNQIKDMVRQFHYHPSIVFWCCHNEPGEQISTLDNFLYDAVITEDNSRIVRKASNYEEHCYEGWYRGKKENYVATPMGPLVTEFGAQALPIKKSLSKFIPVNLMNKHEDKLWAYHNFQFEQTFHIAKISKGNSIDEFIENSQNYQAELLKEAIHYYRRKKFSGINGIFQFMFIDCWESITWSVIDYFGEKKKGFFALKDAFSPLLLSINLLQNIYSNLSKKFNIEMWIINDLHEYIINAKVLFFVDEKLITEISVEKIETDSIIHFPFEKMDIKLPANLSNGLHRLRAELRTQSMKLISSVEFDFEIRNV